METELFAVEFEVISELRQGLDELNLGTPLAPWDRPSWYVEPGGMVDLAIREMGAVITSVEWEEDPE